MAMVVQNEDAHHTTFPPLEDTQVDEPQQAKVNNP